MIGGVVFVFIALVVIVLIAAFIYFVIWGMVVPGRVRQPGDKQPPRRV